MSAASGPSPIRPQANRSANSSPESSLAVVRTVRRARRLVAAALVVGCMLLALLLGRRLAPQGWFGSDPLVPPALPPVVDLGGPPRQLAAGRRLAVWWDTLPPHVRKMTLSTGSES